MKKAPYFAGTLLAVGGVVVALNWGHPVETHAPPVPSTLSESERAETIRLFSAWGTGTEPVRPDQPSSVWPDAKLPRKDLPKVQSSTKSPPKLTTGKILKRQPTVMNVSGHIL
jgi:hypothetical protein